MKENLTREQLEKHLKQLNKKALISEISMLFMEFKEVQEFYQKNFGVVEDRQQVLELYKKKIDREFSLSRQHPRVPNVTVLQALIDDFQKVATAQAEVVSLILYRVTQTISFLERTGEMDEDFYSATENAYSYALVIIEEEELHEVFATIVYDIVSKTQDMNWFFHHTLKNLYEEVYQEFVY